MDPISRNTETRDSNTEGRLGRRWVVVLFSLVEIVFAFRLFFKLFDASSANGFVKGLYAVTQPIVGLFEGIFPKAATTGSVFETATLIAIVVVGLIALGVLKIMGGGSKTVEKTQYTQKDVPQASRPATTQPAQPVQPTQPTQPTEGGEPK